MKKITVTLLLMLIFNVSSGQIYSPVVNYFKAGTPTNGVKIKTNIPFQHGLGMPTIFIEGYSYGTKNAMGLTLTWYVYDGDFYMPKMASWGGYTPLVKLVEENGKIVIFIDDKGYFDRFSIRAYANGQGETSDMFNGWTVVDEVISGTIIKVVPYENRFAGNIFFPGGKWQENGNVGIGTTSPSGQLHIASDQNHSINLSRSNGTYGFRILRNATEGNVYFQIGTTQNTWETKIRIGEGEGVNTKLIFNPDGGNVLIGKNSQTNNIYKLDVNGNIRANEIVVNTTGADFVFENDYKLMPLNELEKFVKDKKHLPEIAPAKEMQENGANLGNLNTKLLQKIEELTLYTIEQNKKIEKQNEKILLLEDKVRIIEITSEKNN